MKFYSTIIIAVLLFGLCILEKKAKERQTKQVYQLNPDVISAFRVDNDPVSFTDNEADESHSDMPADKLLAMNALADSSAATPNLIRKAILNISLNKYFLSGQ